VVLCHYPLVAEAAEKTHLLWNAEEILNILEDPSYRGTVVAYFSGHYHDGGYYNMIDNHFTLVKDTKRKMEFTTGHLMPC
jgi:hypothetical protein